MEEQGNKYWKKERASVGNDGEEEKQKGRYQKSCRLTMEKRVDKYWNKKRNSGEELRKRNKKDYMWGKKKRANSERRKAKQK